MSYVKLGFAVRAGAERFRTPGPADNSVKVYFSPLGRKNTIVSVAGQVADVESYVTTRLAPALTDKAESFTIRALRGNEADVRTALGGIEGEQTVFHGHLALGRWVIGS
jgi:hypothetical protein